MIARLVGVFADRYDNRIVVDCGGVGYEVICSGYTQAALPALGELVTLRVFTHATENKIVLFGFIDTQERSLFDLLITVKNVGPSTAIGILSTSTPRDIATLVAREDVAGLTRIKGIGKKTAEMVVVELHEKCTVLILTWGADGSPRPVMAASTSSKSSHAPMLDEVAAALVNLGWRPLEADKAVGELELGSGATLEDLLRQALQKMPR